MHYTYVIFIYYILFTKNYMIWIIYNVHTPSLPSLSSQFLSARTGGNNGRKSSFRFHVSTAQKTIALKTVAPRITRFRYKFCGTLIGTLRTVEPSLPPLSSSASPFAYRWSTTQPARRRIAAKFRIEIKGMYLLTIANMYTTRSCMINYTGCITRRPYTVYDDGK